MIAFVDRRIVLEFVMIGNDGTYAERVTPFAKLPQHVDGGSKEQRILVCSAPLPLKARLIDGVRAQNLCVADLDFVFVSALIEGL